VLLLLPLPPPLVRRPPATVEGKLPAAAVLILLNVVEKAGGWLELAWKDSCLRGFL
jgi:hypothetical protein